MHRNNNVINGLNTIDTIRIELIGLTKEREIRLDKSRKEWETVKKERQDRAKEIDGLYDEVKVFTHKINILISSLVDNYTGESEAMDLAEEYLLKEIERNEGIEAYRMYVREQVRQGRSCYVYANAETTSNSEADTNYIEHKTAQIKALQEKIDKLREARKKLPSDGNKKPAPMPQMEKITLQDEQVIDIPDEMPILDD